MPADPGGASATKSAAAKAPRIDEESEAYQNTFDVLIVELTASGDPVGDRTDGITTLAHLGGGGLLRRQLPGGTATSSHLDDPVHRKRARLRHSHHVARRRRSVDPTGCTRVA
ncbi:hypothetical protein [Dactylosporangium matsuzakiense]|uniref:hypothetical protein n=1 Tax=Dactylosporangium matsuzakiense TaxID=53360 RepID=UPI0022F32581|nr:hypothetical protein [Dactylosporangium matsuzakiense]